METEVVRKTEASNGAISILGSAIRLLITIVFLGFVFIWIMMPTNTYRKKWMVDIVEKSNFPYLGTQGTMLLIYTFPMLFIAVLGSVCLHLGQNLNDKSLISNGKEQRFALWKQPMVIKGPLGIVSGIELSFGIMFVGLLVWSFSTRLHNRFAQITPQSAASKDGEKVWEAKFDSTAAILGVIGNICLAFLFFPVARGSSVLGLLGLTSEGSIKYHVWMGHVMMLFFTAHGLCYIIYWSVTDKISEMLTWKKIGISNLAGELSLVAGLVLWSTTIPSIMRKKFELFFYTHHFYIFFIIFFILHIGISYASIMLPSFYLFLVDRLLRLLQSQRRARLFSARILPCEALELNFSKHPGLKYNPTSIMFINVPSISKLQWHPFTVNSSSNLEPEKLSVIIKTEGYWTKKLYQILSSPSSIDRLEVAVEGPYGPISTNFLRHDTLVMVSGGSGITPLISIIRELIFTSSILKFKTPRVILICAFKNTSDLTILDLILPLNGLSYDTSNLQLQIEAYITREKEPKREIPIDTHKTIRFKPFASDVPISAILGPNSWLWLGGTIASSFIIFLSLIGVINRYYIYPIDHNTNELFSYPLRTLLHMLVICFCIALTTCLAVLWNKKQNAMKTKHIQNLEGSSSLESPESMNYSGDRELESLPRQSLGQSINVNYGERPNLKSILFGCNESSVGVLVCGSKKMRHEVATICSSGVVENVYFESISFSW